MNSCACCGVVVRTISRHMVRRRAVLPHSLSPKIIMCGCSPNSRKVGASSDSLIPTRMRKFG
ncbi:Uncharacterised protein [Mycobacteroides abscessus subsp. abscessus]|nr:Uncharacterised protein [Mycobacteroides abscessus subsp. abscessus]